MTWHNSLLELTKLTVCIAIKEPILLQNSNLGTQNKNIKKGSQLAPKYIYVCLQFQACRTFSGHGLISLLFWERTVLTV